MLSFIVGVVVGWVLGVYRDEIRAVTNEWRDKLRSK